MNFINPNPYGTRFSKHKKGSTSPNLEIVKYDTKYTTGSAVRCEEK